jgi:predicted Zn-dependent protease
MTRDGTFLIEHGQITKPVKNLRFTQSYLEALSNVEMIGDTAILHREWLGGISAPAIKVKEWSFQQGTTY